MKTATILAIACSTALAASNNTEFAPRVVGGQEAPIGQYTWTVGLRTTQTGSSGCGGSLISPTWVLTAGHCVNGNAPKPTYIAVGTHYLQGSSDGEQIPVKRIVSHPQYSDPLLGNDIALIELARPSKFTPIKLGRRPAVTGESVRLLGWGQTSGPQGNQSPVLKQNDFTVIDNAECQRRVRASGEPALANWVATSTHLCAGGVTGQSSCFGDSGGPLVRGNADGSYSLVGDVSFGVPCAKGVPDEYGRISAFASFIDGTAVGHKWDDAVTPTLSPSTSSPSTPTPSPSTPSGVCAGRRSVCVWPVTGQVVPYSEYDCRQLSAFVWCP